MKYKTIPVHLETYDAIDNIRGKHESWDKVLRRILGLGTIVAGSEDAEAQRRRLADPARVATEHSGVESTYKVCLPETEIAAKGGDRQYGHCGYRRLGRYCSRAERRPAGCYLPILEFNSLPTERLTLSDNPPK